MRIGNAGWKSWRRSGKKWRHMMEEAVVGPNERCGPSLDDTFGWWWRWRAGKKARNPDARQTDRNKIFACQTSIKWIIQSHRIRIAAGPAISRVYGRPRPPPAIKYLRTYEMYVWLACMIFQRIAHIRATKGATTTTFRGRNGQQNLGRSINV